MRIFISWLFIVVGVFLGVGSLLTTASTSIHQIIQNLYFIQMLLTWVIAAVVYPKEQK